MSEERDQPTFTSSGGATMGLPTASLTARTRVNFAVQHMLAAARFARRTGELEAAHAGEQFGDFFNEIMHFASATILFSAAALEANINEIFIDATVHFPNEDPASLKAIWDKLEKNRVSTLNKYRKALCINTGKKTEEDLEKTVLDPETLLYQNVELLISLRNALMHAKPEWYDEEGSHKDIAEELEGKFDRSPFLPTAQLFPQGCMSHGCAKWAVNSSVEFVTAFSNEAGLTDRFAEHSAQLNPG